MKRKDLIIICLVAVVAAIFSFILSSVIFGTPKKYQEKVPVVQNISSTFPTPQTDETYKKFFNSQAINPTQLIKIGGESNSTPFQTTNGH